MHAPLDILLDMFQYFARSLTITLKLTIQQWHHTHYIPQLHQDER